MLSEGITEVLKEASKGKELEDILKEMALNEILKNTRLSARGKEVTYDMNPNLSIYNNPMETGIRFEKRFADGGIASAVKKTKNDRQSLIEEILKKRNLRLEDGSPFPEGMVVGPKRTMEFRDINQNGIDDRAEGMYRLRDLISKSDVPSGPKSSYKVVNPEEEFANGGIASAIGEIQNRKDGSGAMGEGGIGNLLAGEGGLLFDTSSPGTMAADAGILALTVFPPAAIAARLIQAGYKGAKLTKAMNQVKKIQESIPKTGLGLKGSGRGSTFMQLTVPKEVAGVANMADGGAAEKEEEKTFNIKKLLDDIKILLNPPREIAKNIIEKPAVATGETIKDAAVAIKDSLQGRYVNEVSDVENKPEEIVPQIVSQIDEEEVLDDSVKKEVKGRFDFLKDMDPALARALIAGGSAMLRPTEGPVRSFLSLGEFGGAFADSLSKSDAAKTDLERLYATVVAQTPEGEEPPTVQEFLLSQKGGSENLTLFENQQSTGALLGLLQDEYGTGYKIEDFVVVSKNEKGEEIAKPLRDAIKEARTNDDFQNIYSKTILNPSAKKEKSGGFLSTLFGD